MIEFRIDGQTLETRRDLAITLQRENILFAFDKIKCERSTSFDIPATPVNNRVFDFANNVHGAGSGMRVRYACQMIDGVVTRNGYMYVSAYGGGNYKGIFVYGDALLLKSMREAGKLADIIQPDDTAVWGSAPDTTRKVFGNYQYYNAVSIQGSQQAVYQPRPAVSLLYLLQESTVALGSFLRNVPADLQDVYLILDTPKNSEGEDAQFGDTLILADNLPDVDYIELLQSAAYIFGKSIRIYDGDVYFCDLADGDFTDVDWSDRVVSFDSMSRQFSDFAQHNLVRFSNYGKGALSPEYRYDTHIDYPTPNENLEAERVAFEIPFPEGHIVKYYPNTYVQTAEKLTDDIEGNVIVCEQIPGFVLCRLRNTRNLFYQPITGNDLIARLSDQSTTLTARFSLSALEYSNLTELTRIYVDGARYVWTDARWSKGIATIKLAKL